MYDFGSFPGRGGRPGVGTAACCRTYRVGEAYRDGYREWPEGAEFAYRIEGPELTLSLPSPSAEAVQDVGRGRAEFALAVEGPVLIFGFRFGRSLPWDEAPYHWHLGHASRRAVPPSRIATESRALLWVTLVGSDDGIVYAQRGLTLSPRFTRALHATIRRQAASPFDPAACVRSIAEVYAACPPTIPAVARRRLEARSAGNA